MVDKSASRCTAGFGNWLAHRQRRAAGVSRVAPQTRGVGQRYRCDLGVDDWHVHLCECRERWQLAARVCVEHGRNLFLGRRGSACASRLGLAGAPARTHQSRRNGLRADCAVLLLFQRDGQARPLCKFGWCGRTVPAGRMGSGAHKARPDRAARKERGMNALQKGLLLGVVQIALVTSLGAKLSWDRHRFPRAWAKAGTWDPDLPIRGRYLGLQPEVVCDNPGATPAPQPPRPQSAPPAFNAPAYLRGKLRVENGQLASDCASANNAGNDAGNEDTVALLRQQRWRQSAM